MDIYQVMDSLRDVAIVIALVANIVIAQWAYTAYAKTKLPGTRCLIAACCLAVISCVADIALTRFVLEQTSLNYIWIALDVMWIADVALYTVALRSMIHNAMKNQPVQ